MNPVDISLYGILDPEHCNGRDLAELAAIAAEHGVTILQYRDKINDTRHMVGAVSEIIETISHTDIPLVVNDRVDIAMAAGAAGVHLGQNDMAVEDARALMGSEAIIGLSIKTLEDAQNAPVELLDYAFIGGVHETKSKNNPTAIGVSGWQQRAAILKASSPRLPLGAIAGFTTENTREMVESGADGIAIISALFKAKNVADTAVEFRAIIESAKRTAKDVS
ncbi:MAG: thiamine phosphate synthase [Salaquimonas sp.]